MAWDTNICQNISLSLYVYVCMSLCSFWWQLTYIPFLIWFGFISLLTKWNFRKHCSNIIRNGWPCSSSIGFLKYKTFSRVIIGFLKYKTCSCCHHWKWSWGQDAKFSRFVEQLIYLAFLLFSRFRHCLSPDFGPVLLEFPL